MESYVEEFEELADYFKQGKFRTCKLKIKELIEKKPKLFHSPEDANLYGWIMRSNNLICDYLNTRKNGDISNDNFITFYNEFHHIIKEWIYKSIKITDVDLILINNVLQSCCWSFIHKHEENYGNHDNICCVVIALRKVLCVCNGIEFKPPIDITIENPSFETTVLIKDIVRSLKNFEPTCRLWLASNLILILQLLIAANSSHLHKMWTSTLENLHFLMPDLMEFLNIHERESGSNNFDAWTRPGKVKSFESCKMDVDLDATSGVVEGQSVQDVFKKIPIFTCNIFGDAVMYQDDRKAYLMERDTTYFLLLTNFIINTLFGYSSKDVEIPLFGDGDTLPDCVIVNAWKYLRGYSHYKNGRLKLAKEIMEELDFSTFSTHFKTKMAILTASIFSKENGHLLAISILNAEALECQDCLPITLNILSEEYGFLGQKESQLKSLRLLFEVLSHKRYLENLNKCQPNIFFKVLDIIHTLPEITMPSALQKLASKLAHNELYEESAESYLDLIALLEQTGPAKNLLHTIHDAAAALLLIGDNGGVDRSKDAYSLCKRATEILGQNSVNPSAKSYPSSPEPSEDGPTTSKRSKLEINVGTVFMELESAVDVEENIEKGNDFPSDVEQVDDNEEDIFDNLQNNHLNAGEMSQNSINSSLLSSGRDLTSFILLSECAFRENDFKSSILLLNRCLHTLCKQELKEGSKVNSRDCFLETNNFIISYIWLRKAKILIKRESTENSNFSNDIEYCFRNALIHNPDDAEIKYYYLKYMQASGKIRALNLMELTSKSQFNGGAFSSSPPTENLAIWYIFRPTVSKDQYENLMQQIQELASNIE